MHDLLDLINTRFKKEFPNQPNDDERIRSRAAQLEFIRNVHLDYAFRALQEGPSLLGSFVTRLKRNIGFSTCSAFTPSRLYRRMNDFERQTSWISNNIMPENDHTGMVMTWPAEIDYFVAQYVRGLNAQTLINELAFFDSEETLISPRLWQSLSPAEELEIRNAMRAPHHRPKGARPPQVFVVDEKEWNVFIFDFPTSRDLNRFQRAVRSIRRCFRTVVRRIREFCGRSRNA